MDIKEELCKPILHYTPSIPGSKKRNLEACTKSTKEWRNIMNVGIEELKKQMQLAGPLVVVSFLQSSLLMISIMFVGHLDEISLSSASIATSFTNATGFSFLLGIGSALETICGQAYGAKQYHLLGENMQRAMLGILLLCIPISFVWVFTGSILSIFGQDFEISRHAETYARWLIPSIFPYGLLQCQLRFLQSQNVVKPLVISTGITSLIHVLLCWILIFRFDLGNVGAAVSTSISYWFNVLMLAMYINFSSVCKKTWIGFSKEGLKNLSGFFTLGLPSALMVCLEFWAYELLVFMSGLLPNPQLEMSMMSIWFGLFMACLNTSTVIFRIPFGFGSVVSTRVSNELGAGNPQAAQVAVWVVIFLAVIEGVTIGIVLVALRGVWGYVYTNEEEVVRYSDSVMPVLALSNFMDAIQVVLSGAARGCGWQKTGAYVNLGAYYLVGIPLAITFTFICHFGGKGLWMGIIGGSCLQAILLLLITIRVDWDQQALKVRNRVYASSIATEVVY